MNLQEEYSYNRNRFYCNGIRDFDNWEQNNKWAAARFWLVFGSLGTALIVDFPYTWISIFLLIMSYFCDIKYSGEHLKVYEAYTIQLVLGYVYKLGD